MTMVASVGAGNVDLHQVQRRRKWALFLSFGFGLAVLTFVSSYWRGPWPNLYEGIEWAGMALIFVCIFGRTWCTLYIGGRKKRELVTTGPYSLVRNPLYVFSLVGVVGVGCQTGSLAVAAAVAAVTYTVFASVIESEEAYLAASFPIAFPQYAARVNRLWPRMSGWQDQSEIVISTALVRRTFIDACLFLMAIPLAEGLDALQSNGTIPVLLVLP